MERRLRATTALLSMLLMTALLLGSAANAVAAISGVDVEPASLVAGANGDVVVDFTTGLALGPLTTVTITFPDGFDVSGATKPTDCTGATGPGSPVAEGIKSIGIAGQVITLTYDGGLFDIWEAGAKTCTLGNITNPTSAGSTGTYSVATTLEPAVTAAADTIVADVVDEIVFSTEHGTTDADTTKDFDAQSEDQFDNVRADTIVWSIESGSGSVDSAGIFTPNQTGTTVIKATVGAVTNTTNITVNAGAADSIAFTSAPATTDRATPKTFGAKVYDAKLNLVNDTVVYSIDSGSGAINSSTGLFTPDAAGTTIVNATSGLLSIITNITVTEDVAESVGSTGGGSDNTPRTKAGAKAGTAIQPSAKSQMVHEIEMRKGAVAGMTLTFLTEQAVVVTVNTYEDLPTDLPSGYTPTVVHFDIHVEPSGDLQGATVNLAPVLADVFGVPVDELVVLHKVNGEWVEETTTITLDGENVIIGFQTNSLSPFSVAHKEPVQAAPEPGPGTPIDDGPEGAAPSLGGILLLVGMGILLALSLAAVVLSRRVKA